MANVKCKNCNKSINKKNAIKEEYISSSLKIANRYFCSEECRKKFHFNDEIKSEFYIKISDILGSEITQNKYFRKCMKDVNDKKQYFLYVYEHFEELQKIFHSRIIKIEKIKYISLNYKISVILNIIDEEIRKNIKTKKDNEDINEILIDYIDFESLMPKGKQIKPRKTIFDEGD